MILEWNTEFFLADSVYSSFVTEVVHNQKPVNLQVGLIANDDQTPVVDLCEIRESLSS